MSKIHMDVPTALKATVDPDPSTIDEKKRSEESKPRRKTTTEVISPEDTGEQALSYNSKNMIKINGESFFAD